MTLVDDRIWLSVEPLFPVPKPRRTRCPGRQPLDNRRTLNGVLFVLKTNIPWEALPVELGFGSGVTCWRRLREWRADGTWARLLSVLSAYLPNSETFEWSRVNVTRNMSMTPRKKRTPERPRLDRQRFQPVRLSIGSGAWRNLRRRPGNRRNPFRSPFDEKAPTEFPPGLFRWESCV
ncbi:MAG: transposase [candidate division Zixibacteria bacterium]|nr:transposase [candidate division Zixibacteria bacterium]